MYYLKNNINDYKLNETYIIKFNLNINSDGEDTYEILDIKKEWLNLVILLFFYFHNYR